MGFSQFGVCTSKKGGEESVALASFIYDGHDN